MNLLLNAAANAARNNIYKVIPIVISAIALLVSIYAIWRIRPKMKINEVLYRLEEYSTDIDSPKSGFTHSVNLYIKALNQCQHPINIYEIWFIHKKTKTILPFVKSFIANPYEVQYLRFSYDVKKQMPKGKYLLVLKATSRNIKGKVILTKPNDEEVLKIEKPLLGKLREVLKIRRWY